MDILELIKSDHRQIETLISEIQKNDNPQKLYECFNELYNALSLLAEAEKQTFYPAVRRCQEDTKELIDVACKEHNQAKQMLEHLESLSPTSAEFNQKIAELKQVIQHHVQEEESEVFSQVSEYMSQEEREQLGGEFAAVKSKLQSEMSIAS